MLRRRLVPLALVPLLVLGVGACGDDGEPEGRSSGSTTTEATTTTTPPPGSDLDTTTTEGSATTAPETSAPTTEAPAGDDGPKEAEGDGAGTAQLVAVRTGAQDTSDRIVFEFAGEITPGYRVEWVDGPITEDASGNPVEVQGPAFLQVLVRPASGFDIDAGTPTYTGPNRVAAPGVANEVVRAGDFEAQITWVVGAARRVPFTVTTLGSPSRLVIDLQGV